MVEEVSENGQREQRQTQPRRTTTERTVGRGRGGRSCLFAQGLGSEARELGAARVKPTRVSGGSQIGVGNLVVLVHLAVGRGHLKQVGA